MGAWGVDTFHNDIAADWKYGLESTDDLKYVRETLARVLSIGDDYLDADEACEGLAACEVIARLKGNWGLRDSYSESLDAWVEQHPQVPPSDLVDLALRVIDRITTEPSELRELWGESDDYDAWVAAVANLRDRVAT